MRVSTEDQWCRWLLEERFGGDDRQRAQAQAYLHRVRDTVLDAARLRDGDDLVDVGAGDGLVGLGALDRVGAGGSVTFVDLSPALVEHCRELAGSRGAPARCAFVVAGAEDLAPLADGGFDAVTTRAVLIYVQHKERALAAFHRVLRPRGRIALYEPINAVGHPEPPGRLLGCDIAPLGQTGVKLRARYDELFAARCRPMVDFDQRTLVDLAEDAGFHDVRLEMTIEVVQRPVIDSPSWEAFLGSSPNPLMPTVGELLGTLAASERRAAADHLRRLVAAGEGRWRRAAALLTASRR
jgi:arsenite methyltransferase